VGTDFADEMAGHIAGGDAEQSAQREHHVGVVLADALSRCEGLASRGVHPGPVEAVAHVPVHPAAHGGGQVAARFAAARKLGGRGAQHWVGLGESRREPVDVQRLARGALEVSSLPRQPFHEDRHVEVDRLLDFRDVYPKDDVAEPVATHPLAEAGLAHLEPVTDEPLVTVNRAGHHHQALPQGGDRGCVLVVEALLNPVGGPLSPAPVHGAVVAEVDAQEVRVTLLVRPMLREEVHRLSPTEADPRRSAGPE
jgi:hypothetical protein